MAKTERREFIRKSLLGSAAVGLAPSLLNASDSLDAAPLNLIEVDWSGIRNQFVLNKERHYMNTASLGPSPRSVLKAVQDWSLKLEEVGESGHSHIQESRKYFAEKLNVFPDEIAFTRNTTEGVNIIARGLRLKAGDEVILTNHEHVGGASPWLALAQEIGIKVKIVELNLNGENNLSVFREAISDMTRVVFFSHITCSNGMRLAVREICELCREKDVLSCVDGAQALGQINIDLGYLKPDFYVSSGHKWLLGPKGTGILYINKNVLDLVSPTFLGAYSVDNYNLASQSMSFVDSVKREEYGTRDTAKTKGLEAAFQFLQKINLQRVEDRGQKLHQFLYTEMSTIPKVEILSPENPAFRSAIFTFRIQGKDYLEIQQELNRTHRCRIRGIYEAQLNAIRVSCGIHLSVGDLRDLVEGVRTIAKS